MPIRRIRPAPASLAKMNDGGSVPLTTEGGTNSAPAVQSTPPEAAQLSSEVSPRRRGHAKRNEHGRFEPPDGYTVGFAKPPAAHRFKKGNRGGPGRPKGSFSHDKILRDELKKKRQVRIEGRAVKLPTIQLFNMALIKDALNGDKAARRLLFGEAGRLFPEDVERSPAPSQREINASDQRSLAELHAMLVEGTWNFAEDSVPHEDRNLGDDE